MARARLVKPTFFTNEDLATISAHGRLLFVGLWTIADREGRLEDRPKRIKAALFPYETVNVEPLLKRLHELNFIERYEVDGLPIIAIPSFLKHQNPHHREAPSVLPASGKPRASLGPVQGDSEARPYLGEAEPSPSRAVAVTGSGNRYTVTGDPVTGSGSGMDDDATAAAAGTDEDPIPSLLRLWERATGTLAPPLISDGMDAMLGSGIPLEWLRDAIRETGEAGVKSWKYTQRIIERWQREGRGQSTGNAFEDDFEARKARFTGGPLGQFVNTGGDR